MNAFLQILGILILSVPYVWEVLNDKDGDAHISRNDWNDKTQISSKTMDVGARFLLMVFASAVNYFINGYHFLVSFVLSGAIHFLLFDYTIVYVLIKRKVIAINSKWWDYLGSKGIDNFAWWKNRSWQVRMSLKVAVFLIALVIYFDLIRW